MPPSSSSSVATALLIALCSASVALLYTSSGHAPSAHTLPIFFFHGLTANASAALALQHNLSTTARPFIALSFCENACSHQELRTQSRLAIAQIRAIVDSDRRFANGYSFVAHSQGSALARAVIEEMDDHQVHTFISLAGVANGMFYGPQPTDYLPARLFLEVFAPVIVDQSLVNISEYTPADIPTGRLQIDMIKLHMKHHHLQDAGSGYQLTRSPVVSEWVKYNKLLVPINNLEPPLTEEVLQQQARRKRNFLRLQAAHFFASPYDEIVAPWQSSILAKYNDVASMEELEAKYTTLTVVPMKETDEYIKDTYGLQTLDQRGGLTLHVVEKVGHGCWLMDLVPTGRKDECKWRPVFEQSVYPLLKPLV